MHTNVSINGYRKLTTFKFFNSKTGSTYINITLISYLTISFLCAIIILLIGIQSNIEHCSVFNRLIWLVSFMRFFLVKIIVITKLVKACVFLEKSIERTLFTVVVAIWILFNIYHSIFGFIIFNENNNCTIDNNIIYTNKLFDGVMFFSWIDLIITTIF